MELINFLTFSLKSSKVHFLVASNAFSGLFFLIFSQNLVSFTLTDSSRADSQLIYNGWYHTVSTSGGYKNPLCSVVL